jgi:16S rRNA pseudouridine516 synthase
VSTTQGHVHVALHKPRGFSCSHNPTESPIIDELLPQELREIGLQPVGRLDRDTSGLLVLTTDGHLIHQLAQPGSKIEKQYRIGYRGVLPEDAVALCERGISIEGYATPTLPARLVVERPTCFQTADAEEQLGEATLVLHEGRHHQVRRMFRALRTKVVTLHRERLGDYLLPTDLASGELVALDTAELGVARGPDLASQPASLT